MEKNALKHYYDDGVIFAFLLWLDLNYIFFTHCLDSC